jgi:hypothetical protein
MRSASDDVACLKRASLNAAITPHDLRYTWAYWHGAIDKNPVRNRGARSATDFL